jgi:hypothetical protein
MEPGRSLFDLGGLLMDLQELLGSPFTQPFMSARTVKKIEVRQYHTPTSNLNQQR